MFQFNRSQQNHFCTSMLQLFLMKVGRNASTCCQHPQFLIESVDHRLVTISRFMLTLILQTASNLRLAAIISLQYAYLDQGGAMPMSLGNTFSQDVPIGCPGTSPLDVLGHPYVMSWDISM